MLQIHKPLSRKLWIYSTIALICVGGPALVYGMSTIPEYAKAAGITLADISTMQEMRPYVCANSEIGATKNLKDIRDETDYTVRKHEDGKCWMTQNLGIINKAITPVDSDVEGDFTVPRSNVQGFWGDDHDNEDAYYSSTAEGAFYSWYVATAGTGTQAVSTGEATASVCPKGWRLPSQNDYLELVSAIGASDDVADSALVSAAPYNFQLGGVMFNGFLERRDEVGYYWSRVAYNNSGAYVLYLEGKSDDDPGIDIPDDPDASGSGTEINAMINRNGKVAGSFVRCVAYSEPEPGAGSSNINVAVTPMITIEATSGMNSEVEAGTVATGNITARISSNTVYKVLLNASTTNPGNKTSLYRRTDDMKEGTTPTYDTTGENIPATSTVEANKNGWGISNSCNQDGSNLAYLPITTVEKEYCGSSKESATYDEAAQQYTHTFGIGISVSPSLNSGTYETSVTVTGVAN